MKAVLLLVVGLLVSTLAWSGDLYKWRDEDGITRYSDQMPPAGARNVQKLKSTASLLSAERTANLMPEESQEAARKHPISLYAFTDCGEVCKKAEAFLDKRGVPYTLKSTEDDKVQLQKLTGKLEAPALVLGNTAPIVGFNEARWNRELDMAGYAKSNPYLKPGSSLATKPQPKAPATEATAGAP
jgi:glutaredoxin